MFESLDHSRCRPGKCWLGCKGYCPQAPEVSTETLIRHAELFDTVALAVEDLVKFELDQVRSLLEDRPEGVSSLRVRFGLEPEGVMSDWTEFLLVGGEEATDDLVDDLWYEVSGLLSRTTVEYFFRARTLGGDGILEVVV